MNNFNKEELKLLCEALTYMAEYKGSTPAELAAIWELQRRLECEKEVRK